jgi:hypothetical protein
MWRVYGYQTYPSPSPAIRTIKLKLIENITAMSSISRCTDFEVYLRRPDHFNFSELTFVEFNKQWSHGKKHNLTNSAKASSRHTTVTLPNGPIVIFEKTLLGQQTIVRVEVVPISAGEMWYLRLIVLYMPVQVQLSTVSPEDIYENIRTVNNVIHESF